MAQILGIASSKTTRWLTGRQTAIVASAGLLIISGLFVRPASAADVEPKPEAGVAGSAAGLARGQDEAPLTPFAELARSLATAQDRLQELSRLTGEVAAETTKLNTLRAQSQEMLGELRASHADRQELRNARDAAITRAEDLNEAVTQAAAISQALAAQLADEREALAGLQRELTGSEERLADATEQRDRAEAELDALASRFAEAEQQITSLETQIAREKDDNDRLAAELASFRNAAKAATDLARQHQLALESKLRELKEALTQPAGPEGLDAAQEPPASGPMGVSGPARVRGPEASATGAVDDPQLAEGTAGYTLTTPAHAAELAPDSALQVRLVDALAKQREQLQEWMKELDADLR